MIERTLRKHPAMNDLGILSVGDYGKGPEIHVDTFLFSKLFSKDDYTIKVRDTEVLYPLEAKISIGCVTFYAIGTETEFKKHGLRTR